MKNLLKHLIAILPVPLVVFLVVALRSFGASPSYSNFYTNDFSTNGLNIKIKWQNIPAVSNFYVTNQLIVETGFFGTLIVTQVTFTSNLFVTNIFASNTLSTNIHVENDIQVDNNLYVSNNIFLGGAAVDASWINQRTYYVAPWLNNSNGVKGNLNKPWALSNAVADSVAGDFIVMLAGYGNITNQLRLKVGTTLVGMGSQTVLNWWNLGVTNSIPTVLINPADNCFIGYFTVSNKNPSHASVIGGNSILDGDQSFTNVTVVDLFGYGNTDSIFLRHTNVCQWDFHGGAYVSQWDAFVSGHALHRTRFFRTHIEANGTGYVNGAPPVGQPARAVLVLGGEVLLYDCDISAFGSTNGNVALDTTNDTGFIANSFIKSFNSSLRAETPVSVTANTTIELFGGTTTNSILLTSTNVIFGKGLTVVEGLTNRDLSANMPVWTDANKKLVSIMPSGMPSPGYEIYYEPFGVGDMAAGTIGALGWTGTSSGAGGGAINWSNAVNHWGINALSVSASANSIHSMALGDSPQSKPWIPSLSATAGWTNKFIWRLRATNSVKCFFGLVGNANYQQPILENGMGFYISTNSPGIQAMVVTGSSPTFTNIVGIVVDQWYTNEMWSHSAGTVFFNVNGAAPVTLTTPNIQLTPSMGLVKTATDVAVVLEMDEWSLLWARQP